jgi:CRP-like cAMP-binding protein
MDSVDIPRNMLLRRLSPQQLTSFLSVAELVHLDIRDNVIEPNKPIQFVDFPEMGVTSLVTLMDDGSIIEIATIGNEGFVGASTLLGVYSTPEWAFCQVAGSAWRISVDDFDCFRLQNPVLTDLCQRYAATLFNKISRGLGCNWIHTINERCARSLLSTHDRVDGDRFYLTQEFLATMLGVTRSGVNLAAGVLQRAGLITYVRGNITILDRNGLEKVSCPCYDAASNYYEYIFGSSETKGGIKGSVN